MTQTIEQLIAELRDEEIHTFDGFTVADVLEQLTARVRELEEEKKELQALLDFDNARLDQIEDEPKKVKYCCYEKVNGELQWFREDTLTGFKHIPELDREITLPEGV